jgi:hypothetical protein
VLLSLASLSALGLAAGRFWQPAHETVSFRFSVVAPGNVVFHRTSFDFA